MGQKYKKFINLNTRVGIIERTVIKEYILIIYAEITYFPRCNHFTIFIFFGTYKIYEQVEYP